MNSDQSCTSFVLAFRILCYKVYTMSKGAHEVCEGTFLLALPASLMMMLCDRFIF